MFRPMSPPRRNAIFLLLAVVSISVVGCSSDEETEPVLLLDCNFEGGASNAAFGTTFGLHDGLHVFGEGWANYPSDKGVWTLGDEATIDAHLLGASAEIEIACSTNPELSESGQSLAILVNGRQLGTLELADGWQTRTWSRTIPDDLLRQGDNRITLRPAIHRQRGEHDDQRALAVFVKHITVRAELNGKQQETWSRLTAPGEIPADWQRSVSAAQDSPAPETADLPDVLVLLIDAAHASHLGCYGSERATTPRIDELAAGALRFEKLIAPSPFTLVSVPSLLTGQPWRDHLVHEKGDALAKTFTTLAEILHQKGYYTLGMSDNPFVSAATGADQGFDIFDEIWKDPRHRGPGNTPELIEEVFAEYCEKGFGDKPLMAYLHLMPPHTPYRPGPEHDLWGDESYDGDIDGTSDQIDEVNDRKRELSVADHERLVSLYDGNLHRIDASVGRILDNFRSLRRSRPLLVVFLSDHGEAFGQHDWYEHLTTVYDEMVHVPLLLWPASAWSHLGAVTDQLYSLADIAPLLLQKLRIEPPAGMTVTGRFTALLDDATAAREEVVIRTATAHHVFGLRTDSHLLVYDGFRRQELFDLELDPEAKNNLRLEEADLYRSLLGRMRAILSNRDEASVAETSTLSEDDERTLKSLGY